MLEIRKGKSTKSYENDFFRVLAADLSAEFTKRGWHGLLMGMPQARVLEDLQIDCLLVTDDQIILIDFKDYGGDLVLPEAEAFDYGSWQINGETPVRGGSSINPYKQLGKQRAKLVRVLERTLRTFDKNTVYTLVCFQNRVNIIGEVPRRIVSFGIADKATILNKIVDIVDVEPGRHEYLKPAARSLFTDKLFFAPAYQLTHEPGAEQPEPAADETAAAPTLRPPEPPIRQAEPGLTEEQIRDFLQSAAKVMIVTGNTRSGKTSLIPRIRTIAFDLGYCEVPVFAYSNRLKRKMLKNHPELEEVDSLYAELFSFGNAEVDDNYKRTIPIKVVDETETESHHSGELFIIDDSQLITNSCFESETLQFGTGCLLDDLFTYLQLSKNPHRKIVFVGDANRISYGSAVENAINVDYLGAYLKNRGITTAICQLTLTPQTDGSEIVTVCNKIAACIAADRYNELLITSSQSVSIADRASQMAILAAAHQDPQHNKILVYTNEQANQVNLWIKKNLAKNGAGIGAGDVVVFSGAVTAWTPKQIANHETPFAGHEPFNGDGPRRIDNGSFASVIAVDDEGTISKTVSIKGEPVSLSFIPCQVRLPDQSIRQICVFDNFLRAGKGELGVLENSAWQVILANMLQSQIVQYDFTDSDEYRQMAQKNSETIDRTGKPYYRVNDKGEYRLEQDARLLPPELKEFRKRIENKLLSDPDSDYCKIYNAARIRYAWAMTVNKAMADTFEHVYFDTSQGETHGRTNKDTFKWLYTGFAAAACTITLINWQPISPFMHTSYNSQSGSAVPKARSCIYVFTDSDQARETEFADVINTRLAQTRWQLADLSPRPYLMIAKLQNGETILELFFDYNGKGEVRRPRLKAGNPDDLGEIIDALAESTDARAEAGIGMSCFDGLIGLLDSRGIQGAVRNAAKWCAHGTFSRADEAVDVLCWYDSQGMISQFNRVSGSIELFDEIVTIIKETYT